MGKSIRSKIKKKFRTIKREIVDPFYTDKLKICLEDAPLAVRPAETPESYARRNDPRKKDPRLGCAAFALAFPGGVTSTKENSEPSLKRGVVQLQKSAHGWPTKWLWRAP